MTRHIRKSAKIIEEYSKPIFWSLTCLLFLFAGWYVFLVNTAALHGVRLEKVGQEMTSLGARVSDLESSYLSLKQSVTLAKAYEKGFEDVKNVTFITTRKVGTVARANEI